MARPCLLTMYELYYYTYPYIGYGGMGVPFFFFFFLFLCVQVIFYLGPLLLAHGSSCHVRVHGLDIGILLKGT